MRWSIGGERSGEADPGFATGGLIGARAAPADAGISTAIASQSIFGRVLM